jgi:hypothetical protein
VERARVELSWPWAGGQLTCLLSQETAEAKKSSKDKPEELGASKSKDSKST